MKTRAPTLAREFSRGARAKGSGVERVEPGGWAGARAAGRRRRRTILSVWCVCDRYFYRTGEPRGQLDPIVLRIL